MKKLMMGGALLLLLLGMFWGLSVAETTTPPLIRLHLLANSNSWADQKLKYQVRDELLQMMQKKFSEAQSLEESRLILFKNLSAIEQQAEAYIAQAGYNYPVRAVYGKFSFPWRDYGSFVLPAGQYEALRLIIGEGKGANWWCVLFPPLCFVEGEQSLCLENDFAQILEEAEREGKTVKIKPAFKVVELWQNSFVKKN